MARDFKFSELCKHRPTYPEPVAVNGYLTPCLDRFKEAMRATVNLAAMPSMIASHARLDQLLICKTHFRMTGQAEMTATELSEWEPTAERGVVFRRLAAEENAILTEDGSKTIHVKLGIPYIDATIKADVGMQIGVDAVFVAILLQSWTAFETFAADLWVSAVDNGSDQFIKLVLNSPGIKKADDNITAKDLRELQYDARTHLGSFLRDTRRVSFQTLKDIIRTYSVGFDKTKADKLFNETDGGRIAAVAAFRNILAHKAGIVDNDFVKQVSAFSEYSHLTPPETILLDGEMVFKLRESAVQMSFALLGFIDERITSLTR